MFTLLHISDLHRSIADPVGNAELISALVADRDRQSCGAPPIESYDAAIVSGDIIQGVGLDTADSEAELARQYDAAHAFLAELADRFFDGDRSRVIVVPGNHDVDWNVAREAMEPVDKPGREARKLLSTPNSPFRWDWDTKQLYVIKDRAQYEQRFDQYRRFHKRFYEGLDAPAVSDTDAYFHLFELCDDRIVVAAFSSCWENDCYRDQGAIPESAIARAHLAIRDRGKPYLLKIAVWHHSIEGLPGLSDYMDVNLVRRMIDRGFRLGLHGHQHRADAATHHVNLPERTDMVVIAAGSLCAGARELPVGMQRQYNVIEISEAFDGCRVHVREVTSANVFVPSVRQLGGSSFIDVRWTPQGNDVGQPVDHRAQEHKALILRAEKLARAGDSDGATVLLLSDRTNLSAYGRQLLVESAMSARRWSDVLVGADPSGSSSELCAFVEAAIRLDKFDVARSALDDHAAGVSLGASQVHELVDRINTTRMLRNG